MYVRVKGLNVWMSKGLSVCQSKRNQVYVRVWRLSVCQNKRNQVYVRGRWTKCMSE